MNFTVEIAQDCNSWKDIEEINEGLFEDLLKRVLSRYPNFSKIIQFELSILLTDNTGIRSLNKKFRGKDTPTNVLSFPDQEINWRKIVELQLDMDYMYLGDMAFSYQVIKNESENKFISFLDHFKHLTVHAILHLIGYDHIKESDAYAMESIEVEILKSLGIKSPY